jgi:hypothetical protein
MSCKLTNDLLDEGIVRISFDHLHQLQRRLFQLNALRGRLIQCAVNYVRPVNQRFDRFRIESESFLRDVGDEFRARLPRRIQKLLAGSVCAEMCFVFGSEKGRLVMIEPPREFLGGCVFEIDDGVLVSLRRLDECVLCRTA